MTDPAKPSAVERLSGNLITESALTVIAAIAGGPIAPLLPILSKSLAASRQQQRVEALLAEIQESLAKQQTVVENLSDEQYKLVNEAVLAAFQTTHAAKLRLLRNAVQNSLFLQGIQSREAAMLSRIIRDISAEESEFLLRTFKYEGVQINEPRANEATDSRILNIDPRSNDALNVSGLLSLGLLTPAESTYDGIGIMRFSGIVAKVIALLSEPPNIAETYGARG